MNTATKLYQDRIDSIIGQWKSEKPDLDVSPVAIFGRMARINKLLEDYLSEYLGNFELTLGLFDVLTALRRSGFPYRLKPSELAEMVMLTSGGMTGRLDQLEILGFVTRSKDLDDGRVMFAQLTEVGLSLIDQLIQGHFESEAKFLASASDDEKLIVISFLKNLEEFMTGKFHG